MYFVRSAIVGSQIILANYITSQVVFANIKSYALNAIGEYISIKNTIVR